MAAIQTGRFIEMRFFGGECVMKLLGTSLLILTLALVSACQKKDDGGNGGGGTAATTPNPTPTLPDPGSKNNDPFDNMSGPFLNNTETYQPIYGREFLIFNTEGMGMGGCGGDPSMVCLQGNVRAPLRDFTAVSTPAYLQCITGYQPIQNIQQVPIRSLCQQDAMRGYSIRTTRTRTASASATASMNGFCAANTMEKDATLRTNFFFDDRGILNFSARVGMGKYDYLYRATGIGYQYNARSNSLIIKSFTARGNNPQLRYLAVNSLSGLRAPNQSHLNNMLMKEARSPGQRDLTAGLGANSVYQFSEAIMFRFTNYEQTQYSYQQFSSGFQRVGPGGLPGQFGAQNGMQNSNYLPHDPRFSQVDPRFSNAGGETKFLVAGGNLIFMPVELLNSTGTGNGGPRYIPFHDPRN
jgi:hypothetical protein